MYVCGPWVVVRHVTHVMLQDKKLKERMGAEPTAHRGKLNIEEEGKLKRSVVKGNWNMVRSLLRSIRTLIRIIDTLIRIIGTLIRGIRDRAMYTRTP